MSTTSPKVELFYAEWCGHCQHFKPEWEKLKKMSKQNGIQCIEYESEKDAQKMEEENIEGFPTIRISMGGEKQEYNGERTAAAILMAIKEGSTSQNAGKFKQCGGAKQGFTPRKMNKNKKIGFFEEQYKDKDEEYYKIKYFKYKAKYMKKRSELSM